MKNLINLNPNPTPRLQDAKKGLNNLESEKDRLLFNVFQNRLFLASWSLGVGFLLLLCSVPMVLADSGKDLSVDQVSKNVEAAQAGIQDVQMDLKMEMKDSLSGTQQKVEGKVKIKSPDMVYVHYTQPTEQFLYAGGNLVQMYQPAQNMVYQQHSGKGQSANAPIYLGVGKELKKYIGVSRVSIIENSDNQVGLLFMPLVEDAGFDKMKVYIHKKDWWPYRMEVETPAMTTKADFSNISFNSGLKESLFQFTPPKSAQVVEGAVF
jgi:outer membrane lipoprotein carrier protein